MSNRLAILTNIPAPYRLPFFRQLAHAFDVEVLFDAATEPNRSWNVPEDLGFRHCFVRGVTIPYTRRRADIGVDDERYFQLRYGILPELLRIRPNLIVSAEMGPRTLQASLYARWAGVPLILWWEGTPHTEGWVSATKQRLRRYLVGRCTRFWANGVESAQLLRQYGADADAIDEGMIGIDSRWLADAVQSELGRRAVLRHELKLTGLVLLFVGQMVARKGVSEFIAALDLALPRVNCAVSILWVGDGPDRVVVENWLAAHPEVPMRVLGFKQAPEMPRYYAAADVLVLPTLDDNWSLVALEAAVAGLPQIFSTYNGITPDLLQQGAPGIAVDPRNINEFAEAICVLARDEPRRVEPVVIERIAGRYSPQACSQRAAESIAAALR